MNVTLRDYQKPWCRAIYTAFKEGVEGERMTRLLGVAATGAGKTAMASALMFERVKTRKQRCLFLAHTDELCDQAVSAIHRNTGMIPGLEKASFRASLSADIVVGSFQTFARENRAAKFPADHFSLVIADECHLSLADTFIDTLTRFNEGGAEILGITATPARGDGKSLMRFYQHVAAEVPLRLLIDRGYLAPIVVQTAPVVIPVRSKIGAGAGDMKEVAEEIEPYYESIIQGIKKYASDRKRILIFHPSIAASQQFNAMLLDHGFGSEHVDGGSAEREAIIRRFSEGQTHILNNVMLMTAGVDIPAIDCVIMLRPTKSRTTYVQAVGRGTRLYCPHGCHKTSAMCQHDDRKVNVLLLDFLWQFDEKNVMGPADVFADNPDQREAVAKKLADEEGILDLLAMDKEAIDEREQRLIRALKRAASQGNARRYDAREFAVIFEQPDLMDYEAVADWQKKPVTSRQAELLNRWKLSKRSIKDRGHASALITVGMERIESKLATPAQVMALLKFGHESPEKLTFQEASIFLDDYIRANPRPENPHRPNRYANRH